MVAKTKKQSLKSKQAEIDEAPIRTLHGRKLLKSEIKLRSKRLRRVSYTMDAVAILMMIYYLALLTHGSVDDVSVTGAAALPCLGILALIFALYGNNRYRTEGKEVTFAVITLFVACIIFLVIFAIGSIVPLFI